jgi:hypothetical protein
VNYWTNHCATFHFDGYVEIAFDYALQEALLRGVNRGRRATLIPNLQCTSQSDSVTLNSPEKYNSNPVQLTSLAMGLTINFRNFPAAASGGL